MVHKLGGTSLGTFNSTPSALGGRSPRLSPVGWSGSWEVRAYKLAWTRLSPPIAERQSSYQDVAHHGQQLAR